MNQRQQQIIDYRREENRVLREQLGGRRVRFNADQRRRLAAKAKGIGRKLLGEVATIVTPETLLAWHRKRPKIQRQWQARAGTTGYGLARSRRSWFEWRMKTEIGAADESKVQCPIWGMSSPADACDPSDSIKLRN
jgi:hypothetical protein